MRRGELVVFGGAKGAPASLPPTAAELRQADADRRIDEALVGCFRRCREGGVDEAEALALYLEAFPGGRVINPQIDALVSFITTSLRAGRIPEAGEVWTAAG